jgi:hypothetical protein
MDKNAGTGRKYRAETFYLADKIYLRADLVKMGTWNDYCLAGNSD